MVSRMDTATIGIMPEVQRVPCDNPAIMELRSDIGNIYDMLDSRCRAISERVEEIVNWVHTCESVLEMHASILCALPSNPTPSDSFSAGVLDSGSELERYLDGIPVIGRG